MYGFQEHSDINAVRFQLFKGGKYEEELLPPNQDSLNQHARRANYQCYIWRHAHRPMLHVPSFYNHGWKREGEGSVAVDWMTIPAAPESVLEFVNCKCKSGCENKRCSCIKASLKCSDLCQCVGCQNDVDEVNGNEESKADSDLDIYNSCDDYSTDEDSDTECE